MSVNHQVNSGHRGIVMIITLVVLVVMAGLAYTLTTRVSAQRQRNQFIIDYQTARYACDSAFKFAMSDLGAGTYKLIDRPNEPDFSDLFRLNEEQYQQLLAEYARQKEIEEARSRYGQSDYGSEEEYDANQTSKDQISRDYDSNDPNAEQARFAEDFNSLADFRRLNDPNKLSIPGPYGAPWPLVQEPSEFTIGETKIIIEIEDENAKLPIIWATATDKSAQRRAHAALDTFFEWVNYAGGQNYTMSKQDLTNFKFELADLSKVLNTDQAGNSVTKSSGPNEPNTPTTPNQQVQSRRSRFRQQQKQAQQQNTATAPRTAASVYNDFAKLFNSSMVNTEILAAPYIKSDHRAESALKYIDRWGSSQVNVNTAPRHVLEALFTMGGDAPQAAEMLIQERKLKPFKDFNDLQKRLFRFSDTLTRCKDYILTESKCFTIRVSAFRGAATVRLTAAVLKDGQNLQTIGIISD